MLSRLLKPFLMALIILSVGCAPGPGTTVHKYFADDSQITLPFKIIVDDESRSMKSGALMSEDAIYQAFIVGGIIGVMAVKTPGAVGAIRGEFKVGEVFYDSAKSLEAKDTEQTTDTLTLKLTRFRQYIIPGSNPKLKAFMEFKASFANSDEATLSGYACDWENQGMTLLPEKEKNMLNEMVRYSLIHWSNNLLANNPEKSTAEFPSPMKGEFEGNGVKCTFDIFVPAQ